MPIKFLLFQLRATLQRIAVWKQNCSSMKLPGPTSIRLPNKDGCIRFLTKRFRLKRQSSISTALQPTLYIRYQIM